MTRVSGSTTETSDGIASHGPRLWVTCCLEPKTGPVNAPPQPAPVVSSAESQLDRRAMRDHSLVPLNSATSAESSPIRPPVSRCPLATQRRPAARPRHLSRRAGTAGGRMPLMALVYAHGCWERAVLQCVDHYEAFQIVVMVT
jgi:hypothetical protein